LSGLRRIFTSGCRAGAQSQTLIRRYNKGGKGRRMADTQGPKRGAHEGALRRTHHRTSGSNITHIWNNTGPRCGREGDQTRPLRQQQTRQASPLGGQQRQHLRHHWSQGEAQGVERPELAKARAQPHSTTISITSTRSQVAANTKGHSLTDIWDESRVERRARKGGGREKREASLQSSERRLLGGPGRQEIWRPQH
jgi:hypothetical protein